MSDEAILHEVNPELNTQEVITVENEEIKLTTPPHEVVWGESKIRKLFRPWYEMIDTIK